MLKKVSFHQQFSESCNQASVQCLRMSQMFTGFTLRHMSRLSRQEIDLLNRITERFDGLISDFHSLTVFAKYEDDNRP